MTKYERINRAKLTDKGKAVYDKLSKATDGFKDKEAVKKNKAVLDKFYDRVKSGLPEAIKPVKSKKSKAKPKAKAKKPAYKNVNMGNFAKETSALAKKEGISYKEAQKKMSAIYKERKAKAQKKQSSDFDKMIAGLKKKVEYRGGRGLGDVKERGKMRKLDLKKDAKIDALKFGKRTSKGTGANQYGKAKKGRIYYEYRNNRADVKNAPPSQPYPKLESGGKISEAGDVDFPEKLLGYAKGGKVYEVEYWETEEDRDRGEGQMYLLSEDEEIDLNKTIARAKNLFNKQNFASVEVLDEDGSVVYFISNDTPQGERYAKGGMTKEIENDFNMPKFLKDQIIDKNGKRKIDDKSIEMLTDYTNNVMPQTKDVYFKDGKYTKERQKLHKEIIDEFKGNLVCIQQDEPIAILMGGSPASGKSTFLRKYAPYLLDDEILRIDADEVRSQLPEYDGWNASATHLETKDIVNTLLSDRTIGLPCEYDIIYDGTMNNTKAYLPLIKLLRKLGYKIYVVYIDNVPKPVIEKRVKERYQKSGRFVPLEVVDDFFSKGKTALNEIKKKVDGYMVIDGSDSNYKVLEEGGMKLPKSRKYSQIGTAIDKMATGGEVFSEQIARGYDVNLKSGTGTYAKGGEVSDLRRRVAEVRVDMEQDSGLYEEELGEDFTYEQAVEWELKNSVRDNEEAKEYADEYGMEYYDNDFAKGGITIEGNPYKNEDFFIYRNGKEVVSWSADELMEDDYSQDTAQEMFDLYNNDKKELSYRLQNLNYAKGGKTKKMKKDDNWIQGVDKEMERKGTKGAFTKQAKRAGMSTVAFAKEVLRSPDKYSEKTRERAQFMKNVNPELFEYGGKISEAGDVDFPEKLLGYAKGGKTQNEYKVEVLIDDEIDLGTNVFAYSENDAMDKAEELIRERSSKYEDSIIDVINVTKINAQGGNVDSFSHEIARGFDVNLKSGTGTYAKGGEVRDGSIFEITGSKIITGSFTDDNRIGFLLETRDGEDKTLFIDGKKDGTLDVRLSDGINKIIIRKQELDFAKGGVTKRDAVIGLDKSIRKLIRLRSENPTKSEYKDYIDRVKTSISQLDNAYDDFYQFKSLRYAQGGKTQGYNARLDESLAMRDGSKLTKKVNYKGRRDESKGEEKALGKRAYSSVDTMDDAMLDFENFYAKGGKIKVGDAVKSTKNNFPNAISGMGKGQRGYVEEIIEDSDKDKRVAIVEATNGRRVEALIKNLVHIDDIEYAKGGKTQGYNARLDESLAMRRGKAKTKKQSKKDRRDESKGEEKAKGKRAYSSVKTMDKKVKYRGKK